MTDKAPKFWNNPTVILGLMVALIVVTVAVLYFFYTKLAYTKVKSDSLEKKVADLTANLATARTKSETAVTDLTRTVGALQDKLKKLKKEKQSSSPTKKVKCDDNSCEIEDL